jgi:hypothetical protein
MKWLILGVFFSLQNAAFVFNSRARNGRSLTYHGITNLLSNGLFFIQFSALMVEFNRIMNGGHFLTEVVPLGLFFVGAHLTGGLTSHWVAMHWIEEKWTGHITMTDEDVVAIIDRYMTERPPTFVGTSADLLKLFKEIKNENL